MLRMYRDPGGLKELALESVVALLLLMQKVQAGKPTHTMAVMDPGSHLCAVTVDWSVTDQVISSSPLLPELQKEVVCLFFYLFHKCSRTGTSLTLYTWKVRAWATRCYCDNNIIVMVWLNFFCFICLFLFFFFHLRISLQIFQLLVSPQDQTC